MAGVPKNSRDVIVDKVAEAIYRNEAGITDEEYLKHMGKPRRLWETGAPWDTDPNELCEWERDEYRTQARAVLDVLWESREALAAYAHEVWSHWMDYLFSKASCNPDGSRHIPEDLVGRWVRQMNTPYKELPEEEKASDRKEADKIMSILLGDENGR